MLLLCICSCGKHADCGCLPSQKLTSLHNLPQSCIANDHCCMPAAEYMQGIFEPNCVVYISIFAAAADGEHCCSFRLMRQDRSTMWWRHIPPCVAQNWLWHPARYWQEIMQMHLQTDCDQDGCASAQPWTSTNDVATGRGGVEVWQHFAQCYCCCQNRWPAFNAQCQQVHATHKTTGVRHPSDTLW